MIEPELIDELKAEAASQREQDETVLPYFPDLAALYAATAHIGLASTRWMRILAQEGDPTLAANEFRQNMLKCSAIALNLVVMMDSADDVD